MAAAEALTGFTGRGNFELKVTVPAGSSQVEPRTATQPGVPAKPITLSWTNFRYAAEQARLSRQYGGVHFEHGDKDAREGLPRGQERLGQGADLLQRHRHLLTHWALICSSSKHGGNLSGRSDRGVFWHSFVLRAARSRRRRRGRARRPALLSGEVPDGRRVGELGQVGLLSGEVPDGRRVEAGHRLARQGEARHPGARFAVQRAGAAVAVRMTAGERELADLESRYMGGSS